MNLSDDTPAPLTQPAISVIMPTYNRRATLARVLAAYETQKPTDLDFELVVIDDGSSDHTMQLLASLQPKRYRLVYFSQENSGPARARNQALARAKANIILFTGDDIEPTETLLHEHLHAHREGQDPNLAIVGLTRWPEEAALTATMRHIDGPGAQQFSYHYFVDGEEYDFRHFYTSNLSVRRPLLDCEEEYFSEDFPAAAFEDAEFAYRLARHGLRIRYRAAAKAYHHHQYGAAAFFRRQQRCGEMALLLYGKFPELRKYLDLSAIETARLNLLAKASLALRPEERIATDLMHWEQKALRLASFFDPLDFNAIDELLHPLFRYAYLQGLSSVYFTPETAGRVMASFFLRLIVPACRTFRQRMDAAGLPYPRADLAALVSLAQ